MIIYPPGLVEENSTKMLSVWNEACVLFNTSKHRSLPRILPSDLFPSSSLSALDANTFVNAVDDGGVVSVADEDADIAPTLPETARSEQQTTILSNGDTKLAVPGNR